MSRKRAGIRFDESIQLLRPVDLDVGDIRSRPSEVHVLKQWERMVTATEVRHDRRDLWMSVYN